jgi:KH domain
LPIPKIYHPFICGPDNQYVRELSEQTGAHIRVPAHAVMKEEIVISGDKEGVMEAKQAILKIFEEKVNFLLMFVNLRSARSDICIGL